jgi:hypothetical protein
LRDIQQSNVEKSTYQVRELVSPPFGVDLQNASPMTRQSRGGWLFSFTFRLETP